VRYLCSWVYVRCKRPMRLALASPTWASIWCRHLDPRVYPTGLAGKLRAGCVNQLPGLAYVTSWHGEASCCCGCCCCCCSWWWLCWRRWVPSQGGWHHCKDMLSAQWKAGGVTRACATAGSKCKKVMQQTALWPVQCACICGLHLRFVHAQFSSIKGCCRPRPQRSVHPP
jgi:hypothetical protein